MLTSAVVIIGWQLAARGYYWVDTFFALTVSSIIFYLGFKLFQRAIPILVAQSSYLPDVFKTAVNNISAVKSVSDIRFKDTGKGLVADVIVTVCENHRITPYSQQS